MIIFGQFLSMTFDANVMSALIVLAIGVLYMVGAQYVLARAWLGKTV